MGTTANFRWQWPLTAFHVRFPAIADALVGANDIPTAFRSAVLARHSWPSQRHEEHAALSP